MKHAAPTRAWRPAHAYAARRAYGLVSAFFFNLCLVVAPLAAAAAFTIIARDGLYAYEPSQAGARQIVTRVEKLNGELIQLDFDRQRQWDDLVAMELMSEDVHAARGFLLSARRMLPSRTVNQLKLPHNATDADLELAALEALTPGTRSRYLATVPLLSRRAANRTADPRFPPASTPDDAENFELMARALLQDPETDTVQFVLTGFRLGFAGQITPRTAAGARALLDASRRDDYPLGLEADITNLLGQAAPIEAFRAAALASAGRDPGALANISAAFRASANPDAARRAMIVLDQIGEISGAASHEGAVALLTHASGLRDLPKLRVIALAAGDRAAAASKRLQRDGRLLAAARGQLTMTRDLAAAFAIAVLAMIGLVAIVVFNGYRAMRSFWAVRRDDDDGGLVEIHNETWRAL